MLNNFGMGREGATYTARTSFSFYFLQRIHLLQSMSVWHKTLSKQMTSNYPVAIMNERMHAGGRMKEKLREINVKYLCLIITLYLRSTCFCPWGIWKNKYLFNKILNANRKWGQLFKSYDSICQMGCVAMGLHFNMDQVIRLPKSAIASYAISEKKKSKKCIPAGNKNNAMLLY